MKTNFKDKDFPICFLAVNTGIYYGYISNGLGVMVNKKKGFVIKTDYHQKLNTKEGFLKHLSDTFNHTINGKETHQRISPDRFDEIINEALDSIFGNVEGDFLKNMAEVNQAYLFEWGKNV